MPLPYYKRFPRDFLEGTIGLSFEDKGAFAILLDLIFMRDGRLQDDARYIAGQLNCSVRKWNQIRESLIGAGKIQCENGVISSVGVRHMRQREIIPDLLRRFVLNRDGNTCRYCGATGVPLEIDHVHPIVLGGGTGSDNLASACMACNRSKGGKMLEDWSPR